MSSYSELCDDPVAYFRAENHLTVMMSRDAAIEVCLRAADRGLLIWRIEAGVWHFPGFEQRLDGIWDGIDPPLPLELARKNNTLAVKNIASEVPEYDVFILQSCPIDFDPKAAGSAG